MDEHDKQQEQRGQAWPALLTLTLSTTKNVTVANVNVKTP
jgi:hypothetical protein